jgi:ATP-dependent DNA helicase RecQ
MALSAIIRCEESFGRTRIISHLLGSEPEGTLEARFADRSTFGIGKGLPKTAWRRVLDQLLFDGIIGEDNNDGYPILRIACPDLSRAVLKGERKVLTREDPADNRATRRLARGGASALINLDGPTQAVFEALRAWRLETARAAGVPPYVVFHDQVLRELARLKPNSPDALVNVPGIGEAKARRYGKALLGVLNGR